MQHYEISHSRSPEQRKKDFATLKKAKAQEAQKMSSGATYKRLNRRTFVLKNKPKTL